MAKVALSIALTTEDRCELEGLSRRHRPSRQGGLIRPALWMGSSRISPSQSPCQD